VCGSEREREREGETVCLCLCHFLYYLFQHTFCPHSSYPSSLHDYTLCCITNLLTRLCMLTASKLMPQTPCQVRAMARPSTCLVASPWCGSSWPAVTFSCHVAAKVLVLFTPILTFVHLDILLTQPSIVPWNKFGQL
jgi:hypothetical protein